MSRPINTILTSWEATIMEIIWKHGKATAVKIQQELQHENINRSNSAIRKTLRVLEAKGYLSHTIQDRQYEYYTQQTKSKTEWDVIQYIRDLFFHGSSTEMILRIIDEEDVTPEVLKKMKTKLKKDKP